MNKKEIQALRRPFLKELFRNNRFNLAMTVLAALLGAAAELVISWLIKEVADLISGECPYGFSTLLLVAGGAFALFGLAWMLDTTFLSEFRAKAMRQYRKYVFERLMEKGIQAFSGENSALYLSALSNDVNTIEAAADADCHRLLPASHPCLRSFGKQGGHRGKKRFQSERALYRHAEGCAHGLLRDQEL